MSRPRAKERLHLIAVALRSAPARPLRFALTGGLAALVQLALLHLWTNLGWDALLANAVAILLAAQVNFWISDRFTWGDRRDREGGGQALGRRWVGFHLSIVGTALLNMAIFAIARATQPNVVAAASGIGVAGLANFVLGDRLVFRAPAGPQRAPRLNLPAALARAEQPVGRTARTWAGARTGTAQARPPCRTWAGADPSVVVADRNGTVSAGHTSAANAGEPARPPSTTEER